MKDLPEAKPHFAADDDAAVALVQQAVADNSVLAAALQLHAQKDLAGLHGDAVVAHMDVHADDADVDRKSTRLNSSHTS